MHEDPPHASKPSEPTHEDPSHDPIPLNPSQEDLSYDAIPSKLTPLCTMLHGETMKPSPPQNLCGENLQTSVSLHPAFEEETVNLSSPSTTHEETTLNHSIEGSIATHHGEPALTSLF